MNFTLPHPESIDELTLEQCVANGVAVLDYIEPWWCEEVEDALRQNGQTLRMESCSWCVLGAIYGVYSLGSRTLRAKLDADSDIALFQRLGLDCPRQDDDLGRMSQYFDRLTDLWKTILVLRQKRS